ncbi:hypothetical protein BJF92_13580 [Rhizobium rhizosphaerae]|uniref:Tyr recombinase domain-containing protein n=1 Tax=Xaviernesmea rhizosphaerae TaxID=1672749 RepID=A0A1Q9AI07_9HYPH|nr:hypothetical protein [Xaviernesmea rhizosphaerae]OLP54835.1 hypothetical protein BJF92_13580 [Xaviernesmea rhizosphaerae]
MARPRKGARHWHDEKTDTYFIRDIDADGKAIKFSLGFGKKEPDHGSKVELALAKYIAEKHVAAKVVIRNQDSSEVLVADAIRKYADVRIINFVPGSDKKKKEVARGHEALSRLKTVLEFFGEMSLDDLDVDARDDFVRFLRDKARARARATHARKVEAYLEKKEKWDAAALARAKSGRVVRELKRKPPVAPEPFDVSEVPFQPESALRYLQDLNSALTCAYERRLTRIHVKIPLTGKYDPRTTVFTDEQVIRLITHAHFKRGMGWIGKRPKQQVFIWRHLARFMLLAYFTGSRKTRMSLASFEDEGDRPWIELKQVRDASGKLVWKGWLHRLGDDEIEYGNKSAPKIRMPSLLVRYCVKWKRQGLRYPCMYPYSANGKEEPGELQKSMRKCFREVLGEDTDAVIHTFRHTCATKLCQQPHLPLVAIAAYLGMTTETLVNVYAKHREEDLDKVADAFLDAGHTTARGAQNIGQKLTETDRNGIAWFDLELPENQKSSIRSIVRSGYAGI